jgi:5-methylcytosine-specific restriction endonuclease McrBC GTP-binding regulatory subunit McrB
MGLYYDIEDIRRFIAGLGVTKLVILQGMSGTGKTSLAYAFGKYIDNDSVVVPVQPMWKERSDIIGYFNEFTKRFNETNLLRKMYEAGYKKEMYITVLDEVNISRIEYYFAEFLSLLELPDEQKRYLDVVSDVWGNDPKELKDGKIKLPPNMWFVGTANNDDSTFAISDKVYDRAMVLNLEKKTTPFDAPLTDSVKMSYERWMQLVSEARERYCLSDKQEENIQRLDAYLIDKFQISFGNRIMKQIKEYVPVYMACGGSEIEALDDIFSKKVLRKLEALSPSYVRNEAQSLCDLIDEIFGKGNMKLCRACLKRFDTTL